MKKDLYLIILSTKSYTIFYLMDKYIYDWIKDLDNLALPKRIYFDLQEKNSPILKKVNTKRKRRKLKKDLKASPNKPFTKLSIVESICVELDSARELINYYNSNNINIKEEALLTKQWI